ncbi:MAG: AEC family transporter [Rhodobacteraceae bacterium]|nr:AEC family transporter [Paracoccaceae bacterium]
MVFSSILVGLVPSFLMVILGRFVRGRLSANAWQGLDKLNFEVLFPALLFTAAASRPIDPAKVATIGPAVWLILFLGLVAGYGARRFGPSAFLDFAGSWQCAWRFNTAMGFVAVATLTKADTALMAVVAGLAVPVANVFAVSALGRGSHLGLSGTLHKIALNPFLLASLAGVLVGLSGLQIPGLILAPLQLLAQAAIPIALISVGATMNWGALAKLNLFSATITATKLILLPLAAWAVAMTLGMQGATPSVLVVFAALPTASAAHVLAAGFGADRTLAATLVAQSTLLAAISLPLWIMQIELSF